MDSVKFNEIMFAPNSTGVEFIELYNASSVPVDISGLHLWVRAIEVTLPNLTIKSTGFIVFTKDTSKLFSKPHPTIAAVQIALPALINSGAFLALKTGTSSIVDSVTYDPKWGGSLGRSLERRQWNLPNNSSNWGSCTDSARSTPGSINSITPPLVDVGIKADTAFFTGDSLHVRCHISNFGSLSSQIASITVSVDAQTMQTLRVLPLPPLSSQDTVILLLSVPTKQFSIKLNIMEPGDAIGSNDSFSIVFPASLKNRGLVINEIMSSPLAPEPEWIEIYHAGLDSLDLSSSKIRERGNEYSLPKVVTILADSFLVLTGSDSLLKRGRRLRDSLSRVIQPVRFPSLSNSGGSLVLVDGRGAIVDSVIFGATTAKSFGKSFERISWDRSGVDTANWKTSLDTSGATMGYSNSVRRRERDVAVRFLRDSSIGTALQRVWLLVSNHGRQPADSVSLAVSSLIPSSSSPLASFMLDRPIPAGDSTIVQSDLQTFRLGRNTLLANVTLSHDEIPANDTASIEITAPVPRRGLLINEIMYVPLSTSCQWIELYNNTTYPIETSSLRFSTHWSASTFSALLDTIEIPTADFSVIAGDSTFLSAYPSVQPKGRIIYLGRKSAILSSQSTIALSNSDSSIIDTVAASSIWLERSSNGGISLERISTSGASLDSTNWQPSVALSGATPLAKNSVSEHPAMASDIQLVASPNPFSPDGDGRDDVANISFTLGTQAEATTLLRVADLNGRTVRTLLNGQAFFRQGQASFDGRRDNGTRLPVGLYVLLLDATDQSGTTHSTRTGIVIARQH
jgi:hypothetical protein